jgi:NAD(P)-dependent dehydrogenase (short-subunit alcohol dehydrogenase family)
MMTSLIIGAAGTLGRACAELLHKNGEAVIATDILIPEISGVSGHQVDVTNLESVRSLVTELEKSSPITSIVYAAGVNFTGHVDSTDWDQYQKLMQVNLQGAFHFGAVIQASLRKSPRKFSAVFISSTAGLKGEAGGSIYVATKFGLRGFVESFASEIASLGGRANTVCPGNVDSPMLSKLADLVAKREGKSQPQVLKEFAASSAFNRLITPEEVAKVCSWLISDSSSGLSGQTIVVDGPTP